ncbi:multidrug resistance efflux pump [Endobacter medicaginis]|uniref:Multidrug resistance efflux pump n=3 Tax=Endobacter medicaginis TaxID=1181271 RepID=A0A839V1R4_9PROT|nr:HlyD family secretion protein [Endobacter medicaginis]MBB3173469.1 multidrug resistance efflux pump [Endobacter medicaginis]MCX5475496.1 HlyD family secretion protein [Endobacter medicaginis]
MSGQTDQPASSEDAPKQPPATWRPPSRTIPVLLGMMVLAVVIVLCILSAFELTPFGAGGPHTDDSYVHGRVTVIAPQVSGYIARVTVNDYQRVHKGDVLVQIDPSSYRAQVEQAQANVASAAANLANNQQARETAAAQLQQRRAALLSAQASEVRARRDFDRARALVGDGSVSRAIYDQDEATLRSARATVAQAEADIAAGVAAVDSARVQERSLAANLQNAQAALDSAKIDLSRTTITAAADGRLGETGGTWVGAFVSAGTTLFSLVPDERWVVAYFKEAQTARIRVGQAASFTVDALGGQRFTGRVLRISDATGSEFSAVKPDTATGNFVKIPRRIGVYIAVDPNQPLLDRLGPGMSVESFVSTTGGTAPPADAQTITATQTAP